eukprot:gene9893-2215_t
MKKPIVKQDEEENISEVIDNFEIELKGAQKLLNNLKQVDSSKLSPIQQAKMNLCYAYSVSALYYLCLKTNGVNTLEHPIKDEMKRVQKYMEKLKTKESEMKRNDNKENKTPEEEKKRKRKEKEVSLKKKKMIK